MYLHIADVGVYSMVDMCIMLVQGFLTCFVRLGSGHVSWLTSAWTQFLGII